MIAGISSLLFIPLLAVCFAHAMWAFGSKWPAHDEASLARTVTGFRGVTRMPPRFASAAVSLGALVAATLALFMSDPAPNAVLTTIGFLLAAGFLARGIAGYLPAWAELTPEQPFRQLDRKFYSPLCLVIGAGFLFLSVWRVL